MNREIVKVGQGQMVLKDDVLCADMRIAKLVQAGRWREDALTRATRDYVCDGVQIVVREAQWNEYGEVCP